MKTKRFLSCLLTAAMSLSGLVMPTYASTDYVYPDTTGTVAGVEYFKALNDSKNENYKNWIKKRYAAVKDSSDTEIFGELYFTHDAYKGNAAMIINNTTGGLIDPGNYNVPYTKKTVDYTDKTTGQPASKSIPFKNYVERGHDYKISFYYKPVAKNSDGAYKFLQKIRYYNSYTQRDLSVYETTGYDPTGENTAIDTATVAAENKWYAMDVEFTAGTNNPYDSGSDGTEECQDKGITFMVTKDIPAFIVDDVKMYHKVDGKWVYMEDGQGVVNGDFELDVPEYKGADPKNVQATPTVLGAKITWENPYEQETRIYNGETLLATAAKGTTSAEVSGLSAGVAYTLTVKGALNDIESTGVSVNVTPTSGEYADSLGAVAGVEYFVELGAESNYSSFPRYWRKSQYENVSGVASLSDLYLTHDAYKGNAAMLIKNNSGAQSDPGNTNIPYYKKDGDENANRLWKTYVERDKEYKIAFNYKPVEKNTSGAYEYLKDIRYYNNYTRRTLSVYDASSYDPTKTNTAIDTTTVAAENKWYAMEATFKAGDGGKDTTTTTSDGSEECANRGLSFMIPANMPAFIVDNITMYEKVDGAWVLMEDGTSYMNGDFELNVSAFRGLDPENVQVENKTESVLLTWENPQNQETKIYNGETLLATVPEGETSILITDLEANVELTLTLKGVGSLYESNGVNVKVFPFGQLGDTIGTVAGVEYFVDVKSEQGTNFPRNWRANQYEGSADMYLTHDAYEGNAAMLIKNNSGAQSDPGNTNIPVYKKDGDTNANRRWKTYVERDQEYKAVFYYKPVEKNTSGAYEYLKDIRYYNNYTRRALSVYDASSYDPTKTNTAIDTTTVAAENKWYAMEATFKAGDSGKDTTTTTSDGSEECANRGLSFMIEKGKPAFIVDSIAIYHKENGAWVLMEDGTSYMNGDFELNVNPDATAPYEPENFKATVDNAKTTLTWDEVEVTDLAGYVIYNGNEKIADLARNVTSYTVENLENDKQYTFAIVAYDRSGNESDKTIVSVTPIMPAYETSEWIIGEKLVSGVNNVKVSVKNNKFTDGMTAQLILGIYNKETNTLEIASASILESIAAGTEKTLSADITSPDLSSGVYELKAFLWESLGAVSPIKDSVVISE